jgi:peptidoglycan hydrolase-like protein with peptidoglycan-binding domain
MTTQQNGILASAIVALLGAGTAYAQNAQTTPPAQPKAAPAQHEQKSETQAKEAAKPEAKSQAKASAQNDKPKPTTLTLAERTLLQERLASEGFYKGKIDGRISDDTEKAIQAYQRKNGLVPTGRPNVATLSALGIMPSRNDTPLVTGPTQVATRPVTTPPSKADNDGVAALRAQRPEKTSEATDLSNLSVAETRAIQEKLHRLGFYQGNIDGVAGASTQRALRDYYQSQADLADQGRLRADSASTFGANEDIQRVRGEEKPAKKQAKGEKAKPTKTDARTMERGLDNTARDSNEGASQD